MTHSSKVLFFFLTLAILPIASAQTTPPIASTGAIPTDFGDLNRKAESLQPKSCDPNNFSSIDHLVTVADIIGGDPTEIRAIHIAPKETPPDLQAIRVMIKKVWSGKTQYATCFINWAEGAQWWLEAVISYKSGNQTFLITDGFHVALQDHAGHTWYFRFDSLAQ